MGGISLTASMRSNLLSLQNISGQVSSTQNKLATGNKVNSAIDNPSSYYTALSLNNRADDLNALLDSMGQAVSTIKAATTALESATEFLEQAKAVANQALETTKVPDKAFFEEKVGENGAVVTTAQELRDAINAGKETICVYGAIDLGDISTSGGLSLKENQKLVGVGYFGNYDTDTNKFSSISAVSLTSGKSLLSVTKNGSEISDLSISYTSDTATTGNPYAINVYGGDVVANVSNVDIKVDFSEVSSYKAGIRLSSGATINVKNNLNIKTTGQSGNGIFAQTNATINFNSGANVNIKTTGQSGHGVYAHTDSICNINSGAKVNVQTSNLYSYGILAHTRSTTNINSGAITNVITSGGGYGISADLNSSININSGTKLNIKTSGVGGAGIYTNSDSTANINSGALVNIQTADRNGYGIYIYPNSTVNINAGAMVNIRTLGPSGHGILTYNSATCNIAGNLYIESAQADYIYNIQSSCNILETANIYMQKKDSNSAIVNSKGDMATRIDIAAGANLAFVDGDNVNWYNVESDYSTENNISITADNVKNELNVEETSAWELPEKVEIDFEDSNSSDETAKQDLSGDSKQYQEIINQYDSLIKDAGYKGINLLQPERLTVKFNETNTADLSVQGKDMSSKALGFTIFEWQTQGDINASIEELTSAINSIRNYSSELGNNYNIITTRQDFTESLVNVLTEGADKLTLADMNEESANMLALQTRQQLAINSLSLASQASQSILKLF